ncbi:MAG: CHC2 zinc finger domain-containing protein [Bacteroidota bacterium]
MIPDDKKEEVRQAADIVDVVSDHVSCAEAAATSPGCVRSTSKKSPSFNVSPLLVICKWFGCGENSQSSVCFKAGVLYFAIMEGLQFSTCVLVLQSVFMYGLLFIRFDQYAQNIR